jgi:hypothetical protein
MTDANENDLNLKKEKESGSSLFILNDFRL